MNHISHHTLLFLNFVLYLQEQMDYQSKFERAMIKYQINNRMQRQVFLYHSLAPPPGVEPGTRSLGDSAGHPALRA